MLNQEQTQQIKEQLLKQIEQFPEPQKSQAKQQIEEMNSEQLEQFLIQNKLIQQGQSPEQIIEGKEGGCIFCSIAQGKTPAYKIDENKHAVAVLEINPLSKAHSIIIPKKHAPIENIPSQALTLAKKIAKKIKTKFKPEEVKIETTSIGHAVINIIPLYKNQKLEKKQASEQVLKRIQEKLSAKPKPKIIRQKKPEKTLIKISRRIP